MQAGSEHTSAAAVRSTSATQPGCFLKKLCCDRGLEAEGIELHPESAERGRAHYGVRISTQPLAAGVYPAGARPKLRLGLVCRRDRSKHLQCGKCDRWTRRRCWLA
jgi:hypothetical protein